jgi:hypothetical protein
LSPLKPPMGTFEYPIFFTVAASEKRIQKLKAGAL